MYITSVCILIKKKNKEKDIFNFLSTIGIYNKSELLNRKINNCMFEYIKECEREKERRGQIRPSR